MITVTFLEYDTFIITQQKHMLKYKVTYLMRVLIGYSNLLRCYHIWVYHLKALIFTIGQGVNKITHLSFNRWECKHPKKLNNQSISSIKLLMQVKKKDMLQKLR